jgi:cell wall-associated NlpC family hydrolase
MTEWVNDYVGVPYLVNGRDRQGWDCWGVVMAAFVEQRGIELPDWRVDTMPDGFISAEDSASRITAGADDEIGRGHAIELPAPEPWAIVLVRRRLLAHHVGVMVSSTHLLHCSRRSRGTACEALARFRREYANVSFWRWVDGASHAHP